MREIEQNIKSVRLFISEDKYEEAIKKVTPLLNLPYHEPFNLAGYAYQRLGNRKLAAKMIAKSIMLKPNAANAIFFLQNIFYRRGSLEIPKILLARCIVINPKKLDYYFHLSKIYGVSGDKKNAISILSNMPEPYQSSVENKAILAYALAAADQIKESIDVEKYIFRKYRSRRAKEQIDNLIVEHIARYFKKNKFESEKHYILCMIHILSYNKGYYHNIHVNEIFSTFDIGGIIESSPNARDDSNQYLAQLIFSRITISPGSRVVDIGGADGYFSVEAARRGASVQMIEPAGFFGERAKFFSKLFNVEDRLCVQKSMLNPTHHDVLKRSDTILALGVIYHLEDLVEDLDLILDSKSTIVFESIGSLDIDWSDEQAWRYKQSENLSLPWVWQRTKGSGYEIEFVPEWNRYCAAHAWGPDTNKSRQLWIARPTIELKNNNL